MDLVALTVRANEVGAMHSNGDYGHILNSVPDMIKAARRLIGERDLLSRAQKAMLFREPWFGSPRDVADPFNEGQGIWSEETKALGAACGRRYVTTEQFSFLKGRASDLLSIVRALIELHYCAPTEVVGPVPSKASKPRRTISAREPVIAPHGG